MNAAWQSFLESEGARFEAGRLLHFGQPDEERRAAAAGDVIAPLTHLGVLAFDGAEAEAFLHAQLTCDVKAIAPGGAALGAYCSAKGRMLASFTLARGQDSWLMIHSASLTAGLRKRLQMFVLRAKVAIRDASEETLLLGLAGAGASGAIADVKDAGIVINAAGNRFILACDGPRAQTAWTRLRRHARPVGPECWEWLDIRQGVPLITQATADQLVPQMTNLELLGGVSFSKGCYPGQEIVARSQYLGKVKRRMYLASTGGPAAPGEALFSDDLGNQASGVVVNAQPSPDGGYDLLAVAQVASKDASVVRLRSPEGSALAFCALPYEVA